MEGRGAEKSKRASEVAGSCVASERWRKERRGRARCAEQQSEGAYAAISPPRPISRLPLHPPPPPPPSPSTLLAATPPSAREGAGPPQEGEQGREGVVGLTGRRVCRYFLVVALCLGLALDFTFIHSGWCAPLASTLNPDPQTPNP